MKLIIKNLFVAPLFLWLSCTDNNNNGKKDQHGIEDVANNPDKDSEIQRKNLEHKKKLSGEILPCDTLSLMDFILINYPKGTYLVESDKTLTYTIPKPAVIYYDQKFILCLLAKSRDGERLVEVKNIVGYDQSLVDLDSTELGTAFFFLTLFECKDGYFNFVWESPVPSHGGFNNIVIRKWNNKPYAKINFHYAQGIGHIDYNYFFIDGIESSPHMMMTYKGINFKRTIANLNEDIYPDYYEFLYYDVGNRVYPKDSVAFIWNSAKKVYVNTRNNKQTRLY